MDNYLVVYSTLPSIESAEKISKSIIENKLAACINIITGVKSIYYWENDVLQDNEVLLIIKTKEDLYNQLEDFLKTIHPYELPEIIALPIVRGYNKYLEWINESVKN